MGRPSVFYFALFGTSRLQANKSSHVQMAYATLEGNMTLLCSGKDLQ